MKHNSSQWRQAVHGAAGHTAIDDLNQAGAVEAVDHQPNFHLVEAFEFRQSVKVGRSLAFALAEVSEHTASQIGFTLVVNGEALCCHWSNPRSSLQNRSELARPG